MFVSSITSHGLYQVLAAMQKPNWTFLLEGSLTNKAIILIIDLALLVGGPSNTDTIIFLQIYGQVAIQKLRHFCTT